MFVLVNSLIDGCLSACKFLHDQSECPIVAKRYNGFLMRHVSNWPRCALKNRKTTDWHLSEKSNWHVSLCLIHMRQRHTSWKWSLRHVRCMEAFSSQYLCHTRSCQWPLKPEDNIIQYTPLVQYRISTEDLAFVFLSQIHGKSLLSWWHFPSNTIHTWPQRLEWH